MHDRIAFLFVIAFHLILASPRIKVKSSNNQKAESAKTNLRQDSNSDSDKFNEDDVDLPNSNGCYDNDNENESVNNVENSEQLKGGYGAFNSEEVGNDNYLSERSLRAGDIFTAQELLPVTKRYLQKVNVPGAGKGIVSSAKSPETLADTIFTAFFDTSKRIVILEEGDLPGLDAFQALAIDGEAVDLHTNTKSYTERPYQQVNSQGEVTTLKRAPGECHYRLISKKNNESETSDSRRREGIEIAKNLSKKRNLIVNVGHRPKGNVAKESLRKGKTKDKNISRKVNKTEACRNRKKEGKFSNLRSSKKNNFQMNTQKSVCRWKYQCKTIVNLDTCRLHKVCASNGRAKSAFNSKDVIITHEDEQRLSVTQFRKMLGITVLDEEVEKIIQSRLLRKRGNYFGNELEIIQSLEEYFNGIVMAEYLRTTTPASPTNDSSQTDRDQQADLDDFSSNQ